jgi:hypothetical protein
VFVDQEEQWPGFPVEADSIDLIPEEGEDHELRFARIVGEACEQLEKLVEQRAIAQLTRMGEQLTCLERELDLFLAAEDAGRRKKPGGIRQPSH